MRKHNKIVTQTILIHILKLSGINFNQKSPTDFLFFDCERSLG